MRKSFILILLASFVFVGAGFAQEPAAASPVWQVYFSPRGGCTDAVVKVINNAKATILVQAYSFTSRPIAEALLKAHNRGMKVSVLVDKTARRKGEQSAHLASLGVPVSVDAAHAIAHNKVIIVDDATVITGSFNFSAAAEKSNAENLLVIQDKSLARQYTDNWQKHKAHSQAY